MGAPVHQSNPVRSQIATESRGLTIADTARHKRYGAFGAVSWRSD